MTWRSYLSHLECSACGTRHDADQLQTVCTACGKVLFARYDLPPVRDARNVISLGEGLTPLVELRTQATRALGLEHGRVLLKEEGQNPTASFKARGLSAAVSRARELGATAIALPSAGNAGAAAAAYAAAGGLEAHVAMPRDVPKMNRVEVEVYGGLSKLVGGLISDAGRLIREQAPIHGWFDVSTLREPYRQEGKKTMGIELAEQGGWGVDCLPDVIIYPTGGGTGIVGMWKAFAELEE